MVTSCTFVATGDRRSDASKAGKLKQVEIAKKKKQRKKYQRKYYLSGTEVLLRSQWRLRRNMMIFFSFPITLLYSQYIFFQ